MSEELKDDKTMSMGLSRGWGDVYPRNLPSPTTGITGLPDGTYRFWAEADPEGWFFEETRDNNVSWSTSS